MAEIDATDPKAFPSDRVRELAREQVLFLGERPGADLERYEWDKPFTKVPSIGTPRWVRRDRNLLPPAFPVVLWRPEAGVRSSCDVIDEHVTRMVTPASDHRHGLTAIGPTAVMLDRLVGGAFSSTGSGAIFAVVRDHLVRARRLSARTHQSPTAPSPPRGFRWERLPRDQFRYVHLVFAGGIGEAVEMTSQLVPDGLRSLPARPSPEEVAALLADFLRLTRPLAPEDL